MAPPFSAHNNHPNDNIHTSFLGCFEDQLREIDKELTTFDNMCPPQTFNIPSMVQNNYPKSAITKHIEKSKYLEEARVSPHAPQLRVLPKWTWLTKPTSKEATQEIDLIHYNGERCLRQIETHSNLPCNRQQVLKNEEVIPLDLVEVDVQFGTVLGLGTLKGRRL